MWRATISKLKYGGIGVSSSVKTQPSVIRTPHTVSKIKRSNYSTGQQQPVQQHSGGNSGSKSTSIIAFLGSSIFLATAVSYIDGTRYWIVRQVPATKSIFQFFGLPVEDRTQNTDGDSSNDVTPTPRSKQTGEGKYLKLKDTKPASREEQDESRLSESSATKSEPQPPKEADPSQTESSKQARNTEFESRASTEISVICDMAVAAVNASTKAADACKEHVKKVKAAMGAASADMEDTISESNKRISEATAEAHSRYSEIEKRIADLVDTLISAEGSDILKDNAAIPSYRSQVQQFAHQVMAARDKLKTQEEAVASMGECTHVFELDRDNFLREIEAIVPDASRRDEGQMLSEDELNALLAHSLHRLSQLRNQLTEQKAAERATIGNALTNQKASVEQELEEQLKAQLVRREEQLQAEREAALQKQRHQFEEDKKASLAKQESQHQEHLQEILLFQRRKLADQFDLALREKLVDERHGYMEQISTHLARLRGLELALEERAAVADVICDMQDLIASSLALSHDVSRDGGDELQHDQLISITKSVSRCASAGENNSFVQTVLSGIPQKAVDRGIYTASSLERRFNDVYERCRRVAYYPDTDSLLWRTISRVRYAFHLNSGYVKYSTPADFESAEGMSAIELLDQAKYYMDRKCVEGAVKCLVQLSGSPGALATDWVNEARLVLEVKQAANALLSYARHEAVGFIL